MKGMVFTEFLELVESRFGEDTVEKILEAVPLASGGIYTAVGTYHHSELFGLVSALSDQVNVPVTALLNAFADHLMGYFARKYPGFFDEAKDALSFIESVDAHIHVEVRKLYPDAELPEFSCERLSSDELRVAYRSERRLDVLAHGLMRAAGQHFGELLEIAREPPEADGAVPFRVRRVLQQVA